jgi:hypothetical protein
MARTSFNLPGHYGGLSQNSRLFGAFGVFGRDRENNRCGQRTEPTPLATACRHQAPRGKRTVAGEASPPPSTRRLARNRSLIARFTERGRRSELVDLQRLGAPERNANCRDGLTVNPNYDTKAAHLRMLDHLRQVERRQNRASMPADNRFKFGQSPEHQSRIQYSGQEPFVVSDERNRVESRIAKQVRTANIGEE